MRKASTSWIYADQPFRDLLRQAGLEGLTALSAPSLGELVTSHRTSWVRRLDTGTTSFYVKTYDYATWPARIRGLGRNTALAPSRPVREKAALEWLAERGFPGPRVRAVAEARSLGFLVRAVLVTEAWAGTPLSQLLPELPVEEQRELLHELRGFVDRLHAQGFRDGNLDLRNILAQREHGWTFAKIDSPRFRIVATGEATDALAEADRRRLTADLATLGLRLPTTDPSR